MLQGLVACRRHPPARESLDAERSRRGIPGAAIAFVARGAPDELHAIGELDADSGVEVASLSKPVFAFAVISQAVRGDRPLGFVAPPGAGWQYSGEGYVLLQRALEARGTALDELVGATVLSPLGMAR
ncbi:MAG TPA: hypothetical protein VF516_23270, partial [Kofleriaceae bacterium]